MIYKDKKEIEALVISSRKLFNDMKDYPKYIYMTICYIEKNIEENNLKNSLIGWQKLMEYLNLNQIHSLSLEKFLNEHREIIELINSIHNCYPEDNYLHQIKNHFDYLNPIFDLNYKIQEKACTIFAQNMLNFAPFIDSKNEIGDTLLHTAVSYGLSNMVCTLIENGAKCNIRNNDQKTPLDIAVEKNFTHIIDYLKLSIDQEEQEFLRSIINIGINNNEEITSQSADIEKEIEIERETIKQNNNKRKWEDLFCNSSENDQENDHSRKRISR